MFTISKSGQFSFSPDRRKVRGQATEKLSEKVVFDGATPIMDVITQQFRDLQT